MEEISGDKPLPPLTGAVERIDCASGGAERHRLGIEARGGQVVNFAYYNKRQLRTCSMEFTRDTPGTRWRLTPEGATRVQTPDGRFIIRTRKDAYEIEFQAVERRTFCRTPGHINGTMTISRGPGKRVCSAAGFGNAADDS